MTRATRNRLLGPAVALLGLIPALLLAARGATDRLGADPVETLSLETGEWTLRLLLATLAVTPLRRTFGWSFLAPHRRTLGLLTFFYATLHFSVYLALDLFFEWSLLIEDLIERPWLTAGFSAFVLMIPLAVTSTRKMIRRLGKRWQLLHRLIYLAGVAGVLHFLWLVKADLREPLVYAAILTSLLGIRLWWWRGKPAARTSGPRGPESRSSRPAQP